MKLKLRMAMLAALALAAAFTGAGALKSLRPSARDALPAEIYARYTLREESAQYFLKSCDGFVAVYRGIKGKTPESVTAIEISSLRAADRAMLARGIPVENKQELLELLEDLGS